MPAAVLSRVTDRIKKFCVSISHITSILGEKGQLHQAK